MMSGSRSKHVKPSINVGIINSITRLHLVGYFYGFFPRKIWPIQLAFLHFNLCILFVSFYSATCKNSFNKFGSTYVRWAVKIVLPVGKDVVKCIWAHSKKGKWAFQDHFVKFWNKQCSQPTHPSLRYLFLTKKMPVKIKLRLGIISRYYSNKRCVIFSVLCTDTALTCKGYIVCY